MVRNSVKSRFMLLKFLVEGEYDHLGCRVLEDDLVFGDLL